MNKYNEYDFDLALEQGKYNARQKKDELPPQRRRCPFIRGLGGLCQERCMLFNSGECAMTGAGGETEKKKNATCPFRDFAGCYGETCAWYNNGCIIAKMRKEK